MPIPKDLLEILVCPKCDGDIAEMNMFIVCRNCKLAFPILEDYVPYMLIEDSWQLDKAERENFKHSLKL